MASTRGRAGDRLLARIKKRNRGAFRRKSSAIFFRRIRIAEGRFDNMWVISHRWLCAARKIACGARGIVSIHEIIVSLIGVYGLVLEKIPCTCKARLGDVIALDSSLRHGLLDHELY